MRFHVTLGGPAILKKPGSAQEQRAPIPLLMRLSVDSFMIGWTVGAIVRCDDFWVTILVSLPSSQPSVSSFVVFDNRTSFMQMYLHGLSSGYGRNTEAK